MGFALQTKPMPARVAEAFEGQAAELHEIPVVEVDAAMTAGRDRAGTGRGAGYGLLAASLYVDGKPVGLDAVLGAPGRFFRTIGLAMTEAMLMHGFGEPEPEDGEGIEAGDATAPKH
jgi:hypothetical protein